MNAAPPSIPARYFALLINHLEAGGTPCRGVLSAAQLRALDTPQAVFDAGQTDALITQLGTLTGRQDLGFELGQLIKVNSHDVLGYAIISCPTIDHILRLAARYYRLMTPAFTMRYLRHGAQADLQFQPALAMSEQSFRFCLEMLAVSFHAQLMAMSRGRQAPYTIHLSMPEPAHAGRYRELAPASIYFEPGPRYGMRVHIGTELFDEALAMTDARTLHQAEARCKLLMQQFSANGQWREWVAMMLREADDSQPTLDELAAILNLSARTLNRHLEREGASFRTLALEIRSQRACQLLAEGKYSIAQVAARLGYSDTGNFSRWFKRQHGVVPGAYAARGEPQAGTS